MTYRLTSVLAALILVVAGAALAHHVPDPRERIFIIERGTAELVLYARIPAPLVYAGQAVGHQHAHEGVEAPYLVQRRVGGHLTHELDLAAIGDDPDGFAAFVAAGYGINNAQAAQLMPERAAVRVHPIHDLPPFGAPAEARAALSGGGAAGTGSLFVGDAYVDLMLAYDTADGGGALTLVAKLDPMPLPPEIFVSNLILDHGPQGTVAREVVGQFREVVLPPPGAAPSRPPKTADARQ